MQVIAVNRTPRKAWNTATLPQKALEGAASRGAEVDLVHLYDSDFKGYRICYACKPRCSLKTVTKRSNSVRDLSGEQSAAPEAAPPIRPCATLQGGRRDAVPG